MPILLDLCPPLELLPELQHKNVFKKHWTGSWEASVVVENLAKFLSFSEFLYKEGEEVARQPLRSLYWEKSRS